jgi:methylmalonyl-CoA/ethylmalonyl-CoA epimerase
VIIPFSGVSVAAEDDCTSLKSNSTKILVMLKRFDHVSIAVENIQDAYRIYRDVLDGKILRDRTLSFDRSFSWAELELGGSKLELIQPEDQSSFVGRFLDQKGSKIHHITYEVERIEVALAGLERKGIEIIGRTDEDPEWKMAFLSPKTTHGVLIQLFERKKI